MAAIWPVLGFGGVLWSVHLLATRLTGLLPEGLRRTVGASADTLASRPWTQLTALWFHETWFHISYNSVLLLLTMPFAISVFGSRALFAAIVSSPLAAVLLNLLVILPLARAGNEYALEGASRPLVGASVVVFAGVGLALMATGWSVRWKLLVVAIVVAYELLLAVRGLTRPMVGLYHLGGFALGLAWALAFQAADLRGTEVTP